MGFSFPSRSPCQLKSVSLRSNEEFVRLYNDMVEAGRLRFQRARVVDDVQVIALSYPERRGRSRLDGDWQLVQETISHVDHLMKRVEKCAQSSEVLAGIMLDLEQDISDVLRNGPYFVEIGAMAGVYSSRMLRLKLDLEDFLDAFEECTPSELESAHEVVLSALALLSFVYQHLIGCVDKGGGKTYSRGSFLFRLIFVAIVLFLGSYVWIKRRQVSYTTNRRKRKSCALADRASQLGDESDVPGGVYRRAVKDTRGSITHYKYEPRLKPRREKLESGTSLMFNYLPLGSYKTSRQAEIVRHIAAVLYGKECRPVQFEDGLCLPIPSVTEPENCPPSGKEKADWVTLKTKELYAELLGEKARRENLLHPAIKTGSHHGHDGEARRRDPSPSAPGAHGTAAEVTCFTPPHGGNGVEERATISESHGLGQEAALAQEVLPSDFDFDQVMSSMRQLEVNGFPEMDDLGKVVGDNSETDLVFGLESPLVPPQSSAWDNPTSAISSSLLQLGGGDQGLGVLEPDLNSATAIAFQQSESFPEQVQLQLRVTCQEKHPEDFQGSNVELQQRLLESKVEISELQQKLREFEKEKSELEPKLLESELRYSELQQKLRKAEVENEKLRSLFHQVAQLI